jgi:hypothetical protein
MHFDLLLLPKQFARIFSNYLYYITILFIIKRKHNKYNQKRM